AAMWRVEGDTIPGPEPGPACVEAALGAVAMQHLDIQFGGKPANPERRTEIAQAHGTRHRGRVDAQRGIGPQSFETLGGQSVRGQAVGDDADLVPARRQFLREVADMAEQPAYRRPEDLQDAQRA